MFLLRSLAPRLAAGVLIGAVVCKYLIDTGPATWSACGEDKRSIHDTSREKLHGLCNVVSGGYALVARTFNVPVNPISQATEPVYEGAPWLRFTRRAERIRLSEVTIRLDCRWP
jgi:hypothetical protein